MDSQQDLCESTYILESVVRDKKMLGQLKRKRNLHDDYDENNISPISQSKKKRHEQMLSTALIPYSDNVHPNSQNAMDEFGIAHNIIVDTNSLYSGNDLNETTHFGPRNSQVMTESIEGSVLLASNTPIHNPNFSSYESEQAFQSAHISSKCTGSLHNEQNNMSKIIQPNTVTDIASKLDSLDDDNLAILQNMIIEQRMRNYDHVSSNNFGDKQDIISPFLPVCTIDNIRCGGYADDPERKPVISETNREEIYNIPNSLVAYIYNENTQDVVKVKMIQHNEEIASYTQIEPPIISSTSHEDPLAVPKQKLKTEKSHNGVRSITAKWKRVTNRDLHTKFISHSLGIMRTNATNSKSKNKPKRSSKFLHKYPINGHDPDYRPHSTVSKLKGNDLNMLPHTSM